MAEETKKQEEKIEEAAAKEAADKRTEEAKADTAACEAEAEGAENGPEKNGEEEAAKSEGAEAEDDRPGEEKKKGFWDRKKDKEAEKKDAQIEELTDRVRRTMAEFDNFRKRTEKEKVAMYEVGAKSVIEKILPVVDNFERGLKALPEEEKEDPFAQGMDKIYKQLLTTLEEMDVKPIEAVGKEFDPSFHNAVMHVEDEEAGENIIVEEFQKGYTYRDSVVRHSMVKVAN